ncbi:MAG TPA: metalloregulator ArsR/SmtB family transcription factor [Candidatus Paceibacterota bacterium]|nr:metalloregulator ArsR/SmtB family transcription factor [Candidatus Paceibacterota bacterium]
MHLNELAKKIRTVGDESRLRILCVIFEGRKICVSEIAAKLDMSVAIVSHHLRALQDEGLLIPMRDGKHVCYEISDEKFMEDLKKFICKYNAE